jgi:hypothetical protein
MCVLVSDKKRLVLSVCVASFVTMDDTFRHCDTMEEPPRTNSSILWWCNAPVEGVNDNPRLPKVWTMDSHPPQYKFEPSTLPPKKDYCRKCLKQKRVKTMKNGICKECKALIKQIETQ